MYTKSILNYLAPVQYGRPPIVHFIKTSCLISLLQSVELDLQMTQLPLRTREPAVHVDDMLKEVPGFCHIL